MYAYYLLVNFITFAKKLIPQLCYYDIVVSMLDLKCQLYNVQTVLTIKTLRYF